MRENFEKRKREKEIINNLKEFCKDYSFKFRKYSEENISIQAKDTDKHYHDWIKFDLAKNDLVIIGNTDQLNLWFCQTRKDLTSEKIIKMVGDLNKILLINFNCSLKLSSLIDPEDWQEIAGIYDAYKDNWYNIKINNVSLESNNYINFTLSKGPYELGGLFRIKDEINGLPMQIVSIECFGEDDKNFINAHYGEIENKLIEIAKEYEKDNINTMNL
ncbi:MAG: hypothetical protein Q4G09_00235 [Clostridia bacterium]|nr:hypothetical protein [Clostridia bacterium]